MKKLKYLLFILLIIPFNVFADTVPMDNYTSIGNTTTKPIHLTVNGSSSSNFTFYTYDEINLYYDNFNYFGYTICSNSLIQIKRTNNAGSSCNESCYSNDMYLQLVSGSMMNSNKCSIGNVTNGYLYYFYFGANKWYDLNNNYRYYIADQLTITNLGTSSASIYFYNAIAFNDNPIPNLLQSDTIIDNNSQNTQEIIDNQNQNTQEIIENDYVCGNYTLDKKYMEITNYYLSSDGRIIETADFGISGYIHIDNNSTIKVLDTRIGNTSICFYTKDKSLISCIPGTNLSVNQYVTIPNNAYYLRYSLFITTNKPSFYVTNGCMKGNNVINDSIGNVNDSINNSGIDNPNSDFSDMEDLIAHNGVITNLIALPITLYTSILNNVNSSCTDFNLGSLYNKNITFSCINLGSILGSTIWGVIDVLFSGFTIYAISKKMIKVFQNFSGLQEGDVIDD